MLFYITMIFRVNSKRKFSLYNNHLSIFSIYYTLVIHFNDIDKLEFLVCQYRGWHRLFWKFFFCLNRPSLMPWFISRQYRCQYYFLSFGILDFCFVENDAMNDWRRNLLRFATWRNVFVVDLSVMREWGWNRSKWARADIFLGGGSQFYVQPWRRLWIFTSLPSARNELRDQQCYLYGVKPYLPLVLFIVKSKSLPICVKSF